ncbi:MAG: hypothetical protein NC177_12750 [Ruminococcus flavefaciens]|nr:hypothetical protein [Ruminococcus flavefaciens]
MRIDLCENKITLTKIKSIICIEKDDVKFLNKIFSPLVEEERPFYESYSIKKHRAYFMNGNIIKNYNKSSENYDTKQRDKICYLKRWANMLVVGTAFDEMLDIVKEVTVNLALNRHHEVFSLIELDIEIMPNMFMNFLNVCLEENECEKALLMLILWSIYGECIVYIEDIYAVSKKSVQKSFQKSVRLISHIKPCRPVFMGRDEIIDSIHNHFMSGNHFVFLKGMGGIGKSECAKQYAEKYKSEYNTIVFAECMDSLVNLINDNSVFTLTVPFVSERMPNESDEEFFCRKIAQIKEIADEKTLVIIDNLDFISTEIESLIAVPFRLIITTRCDYSTIYQQETKFIEEINDKIVLRSIFIAYYGKNISDFANVDRIIDMFSGHTMAVELVAKQMNSACMRPDEMLDILQKSAESELEEKFIMPNHSKEYQTFPQHMLTLFNISTLNDEEKYILMCLALMPLSGIDKRSFKQACGLKNFNSINRLIDRSWISENDDKIYLHTLIKETVFISCRPDLIKCYDFINGLMCEYPTIKCWHSTIYQKSYIKSIVENIYNMFPVEYVTSELYDFYEWAELMFNHFNNNNLSLNISHKLLKIYRETFGENHFRTAKRLARIACVEKDLDNIDKAEELFYKSRKIILGLNNKSVYETFYLSHINLVLSGMIIETRDLSNDKDLLDEIKTLSEEAISIIKNLPVNSGIEPLSLNCASLYRNLAWVEIYNNNYDKVYFYLDKIVEECERLNCERDYFLKEYLEAIICNKNNDLYNAVVHMNKVVSNVEEFYGKQSIHTIHMKIKLGDIYFKSGDTASAYEQYRTALGYLEKMPYRNEKLRTEILQKIHSVENI